MYRAAKSMFFICLIGFSSSALKLSAQVKGKATVYNLSKLASGKRVTAVNRAINVFTEPGRQGIYVASAPGEGSVWIESVEFDTGIIELDIKGRDVFQKSFLGIAFHGASDSIYEAVYFRPFNFNASDSVRKIHAVQYVFHPKFTWQMLREHKNGQYEKAVQSAPGAQDWFHAKILITKKEVEVFVNGNSKASLKVQRLTDRKSGRVGLWVGNGSDGYFANLKITRF